MCIHKSNIEKLLQESLQILNYDIGLLYSPAFKRLK